MFFVELWLAVFATVRLFFEVSIGMVGGLLVLLS